MSDSKRCPKCGSETPKISLFCPKCGMMFEKQRSNVGKVTPPVPPARNNSEAPKPIDDKAGKTMRIRKKVAEEILSTEKNYVAQLSLVCDKFLEPLRKADNDGKPIISQQEIQMVFSVISVIKDLNRKFLQHLEPLITNYTLNTMLGNTILDFAPYFKMYTQYVNAHENDKVQQFLRKLDQKAPSSPFKTFCYEVAKTEMCLPLPALLITPVQRVPRYRLLVAEYLKNTDKSHPDYEYLLKALEKVKETAMIINEAVRRQQQRQTVMDLEQKFSSNPEFISPSRIFKMQGPLMKKCRADDRKYEFFLFNDLFVYGKENSKDRYTLHKKIPIDMAFNIKELPDAEDPFSFQIINSVKSFVVYSASESEKREWINSLQEAVEERRKAVDKGDSSFVAPVWESDKKKECQRQRKPDGSQCNSVFGVFKRKHHCRQCGVLCCNECSPYNVFLTKDAKKKERVCTTCILALMEIGINNLSYKPSQLPVPVNSEGKLNFVQNTISTSSPLISASSASSATASPRAGKTPGKKVKGNPLGAGPPPPPVRPTPKVAKTAMRPQPRPSLPPRRRSPEPQTKKSGAAERKENPSGSASQHPPPVREREGMQGVPGRDRNDSFQARLRRAPPVIPKNPPPALPKSSPPPLPNGHTHARNGSSKPFQPPNGPPVRSSRIGSSPRPPAPMKTTMRVAERSRKSIDKKAEERKKTAVGRPIGKLKGQNERLAALMAKFQKPN